MENNQIIDELQGAIERLAEAVADEPKVARALRGFAGRLPEARRGASSIDGPVPSLQRAVGPERPLAFRELLVRALDEGAIDGRGFDWMMLGENRARRAMLGRQTRQT